MVTEGADAVTPPRGWRSRALRLVRNGAVIFVTLFLVELLVVPKLAAAGHNLSILHQLNIGWLAGGILAEAASLFCYALLTQTLLPRGGPSLSRVFRIDLATAAVAHVVPAGAAGSAPLGYHLLTNEGVDGSTVGFVMATQAIGSAVVLNVMLWVALVISIPLAGIHTIYVIVALAGLIMLSSAAVLAYTLIRGEAGAVRFVRAIGSRIPRVGADRLEGAFLQIGKSLHVFVQDRDLRSRALLWATLNWFLDAASLWLFIAALGQRVDPIGLFAAYGIAMVLGALPITPGGLAIVEGTAIPLLVSFGLTHTVATLGVIGWRLVNFWLPIPVGAGAFVSLRVGRGSSMNARRQALSELATYTHTDHPSLATKNEQETGTEGEAEPVAGAEEGAEAEPEGVSEQEGETGPAAEHEDDSGHEGWIELE